MVINILLICASAQLSPGAEVIAGVDGVVVSPALEQQLADATERRAKQARQHAGQRHVPDA